MKMADEGRNRDVRTNVLRTSKRGPNADVSGRPQNVRQRTSKRGPNADVSGRPQNVRQRTLQSGPNPDIRNVRGTSPVCFHRVTSGVWYIPFP